MRAHTVHTIDLGSEKSDFVCMWTSKTAAVMHGCEEVSGSSHNALLPRNVFVQLMVSNRYNDSTFLKRFITINTTFQKCKIGMVLFIIYVSSLTIQLTTCIRI